jgi:hypothetical protein
VFNDYQEVSGLKLNEGKSVIPLGTSMGMTKPPHIPCKWLFPSEGLLGIQVGSLYCDDALWNKMGKKLYRSIRQWIPKHLSIYGRICAAKSYIASNSWYLASVIPPKPKVVTKSKAVLWNFVQNNKCFEEEATTNHYLSRWSSAHLDIRYSMVV